MPTPRRFLLVILLALVVTSSPRADEGMWPFSNIPRAAIQARYGVALDDAWLTKVQRASVRFNNGGSGSFVSPEGLALTNHHVARDTLAKLSSPEYDLVAEGFLAERRRDELKAPDLELNVLVSYEDVTARVDAAVTSDMAPADALAARRAAIAEIERQSLYSTKLRSDVVTLYQGRQYHLYRYKRYTDVRVVFAPEESIAFFGGDIDNFEYPRYALDMTLVRVYEDDEPAQTADYVAWAPDGARDGEPVFVSGHPGGTSRLSTLADLETRRRFRLPFMIRLLDDMRAGLAAYSERGDEEARQAGSMLTNLENNLKVFRGQVRGLADETLMAKKRAAEQALRTAVAASPARDEAGGAWDAIADARNDLGEYYAEMQLIDRGLGFNSQLFGIARTLVRLAEESEKPDGERLPGFTEAARPSMELQLFSPAPIHRDYEQAALTQSLTFMRDELGAEHPVVRAALLGASPGARAEELVRRTRVGDVDVRRQLAGGGRQALERSNDPMIALARSVDPAARALLKRYEDEVVSIERERYAQIARAEFDAKGLSAYPDATFTLRLTYGAVRGYEEAGTAVPALSRIAGLYARADEHDEEPPYWLPSSWQNARDRVDPTTPFNFVSTVDIIGGNSGSPVLNADGDLVGLIFDGNVHSLNGDFIYDETLNRAIAVDVRGMLEALRSVYEADGLVEELVGVRVER